jgi:hypothetical protein
VQRILLLNIGGLSFTASEWHALYELHLRYQKLDRDLWAPREFTHHRFLRWLAGTGRLVEDGRPAATGVGAGALGQ